MTQTLSKSLAVVVPCYNEAARLPVDRFAEFIGIHPDIHFCFVDDGSTDRTGAVLEDLAGRCQGRVLLHRLDANEGKAEAVRQGMLHVMREWQPEYVGFLDADLATPLDQIPLLMDRATAKPLLALVTGSRVVRLGAAVCRTRWRHFTSRVFAMAAGLVLGVRVYDTQCGAKIMRADLAATVFAEPFVGRWTFDVEIFARTILKYGMPAAHHAMCEVPLEEWVEVGGSKLKLKYFVRAPLELFRIWRRYRLHARKRSQQ